ncbi:RDD family protein [Adhaeribacter arboris]|uniref:RDD family protein n=1 Tax=Adhaeribacter arboris TaxID=2072846 RepID=A0A2T2YLV8_9BACT|nr:RDD family protein [Adhaeribacter arboris]PSR56477.1 RDD family protein [Adhaeribacter arboris]
MARKKFTSATFPSLRRRFASYFIDLFIIIGAFMLVGYVIDLVGSVPGWLRGSILIFTLFLYDPIFISLFGGTIGHQLLDMRVIHVKSSGNLNFGLAVLRFVVKVLLGWLSFLTIMFNPERRAIHDIISDSLVIKLN